MPLHLLGKKSWNVYNPENVARVRRDEATAKAQDEREERDKQTAQAASRLQILRGAASSDSLPDARVVQPGDNENPDRLESSRPRKRRKLAGENDTDRDIRLAKTDLEATALGKRQNSLLLDSNGDISLIDPAHRQSHQQQQSRQDSRDDKDNVGMRLRDAAGYKADDRPWYTSSSNVSHLYTAGSTHDRDVWGNEDPRRQEREKQQLNASDPLMAMKKGVRQLREVENNKRAWMAQRERDLYEVEKLARDANNSRRRRQRRRSISRDDDDDLEGFRLDAGPTASELNSDDKSRTRRHDVQPEDRRRKHQYGDRRGSGGERRHSETADGRESRHHHHHRHRHRHDSRNRHDRPLDRD